MPKTVLTSDLACAALLRYFVNQFATEPPITISHGALFTAIQLPEVNVLLLIKSEATEPTGQQLKQMSVDYNRDVLFVRPGQNPEIPVVMDAVFGTPAGPLLLSSMTACRLSADLLWLVPPAGKVRVAMGIGGMRLMVRERWWASVDLKAGQARATAEIVSSYLDQVVR